MKKLTGSPESCRKGSKPVTSCAVLSAMRIPCIQPRMPLVSLLSKSVMHFMTPELCRTRYKHGAPNEQDEFLSAAASGL